MLCIIMVIYIISALPVVRHTHNVNYRSATRTPFFTRLSAETNPSSCLHSAPSRGALPRLSTRDGVTRQSMRILVGLTRSKQRATIQSLIDDDMLIRDSWPDCESCIECVERVGRLLRRNDRLYGLSVLRDIADIWCFFINFPTLSWRLSKYLRWIFLLKK